VLKYRPDIDGLRALAVVPVVLFHADTALSAGGFVGVDIFFVISGYLITTMLLQDLTVGRFSTGTRSRCINFSAALVAMRQSIVPYYPGLAMQKITAKIWSVLP